MPQEMLSGAPAWVIAIAVVVGLTFQFVLKFLDWNSKRKAEAELTEYREKRKSDPARPAFREDHTGQHNVALLLERDRDRDMQEIRRGVRENHDILERLAEASIKQDQLMGEIVKQGHLFARAIEAEQESHAAIIGTQKEMALAMTALIRRLDMHEDMHHAAPAE